MQREYQLYISFASEAIKKKQKQSSMQWKISSIEKKIFLKLWFQKRKLHFEMLAENINFKQVRNTDKIFDVLTLKQ